jgi:hypothetical protein
MSRRCRLVLLGEDGEHPPASLPSSYIFTEERTTLGRSRSSDITLDSITYPQTLSRRHVTIWRESLGDNDYQWHVTDENTMNGTFIDCVKVQDSVINDGEILTLGGGAGLELGQRSELLASDLVFRFEIIPETEITTTHSNELPSVPTSSPAIIPLPAPPTTTSATQSKIGPNKIKDTSNSAATTTTAATAAASATATATTAATATATTAASTTTTTTTTTAKTFAANTTNKNETDTEVTNLKGDSGLLASVANVTTAQARDAINNEDGNILLAQQKLFRDSMLAEVKCAVCCKLYFVAL